MSYIKEVEVLDDEDQYNECLMHIREWRKHFLMWQSYYFRDLVKGDEVRLDESARRMKDCAQRLAHHAREAMKYKAVM